MSRIGRLPVSLPKGVTFTFAESNFKIRINGLVELAFRTFHRDFMAALGKRERHAFWKRNR